MIQQMIKDRVKHLKSEENKKFRPPAAYEKVGYYGPKPPAPKFSFKHTFGEPGPRLDWKEARSAFDGCIGGKKCETETSCLRDRE